MKQSQVNFAVSKESHLCLYFAISLVISRYGRKKGVSMSDCKILVSYSRADDEPPPGFDISRKDILFRKIRHELKDHDSRSPWTFLMDKRGVIHGGDEWDAKFFEAMEACHIGLAFLTESYVRSEPCRRELAGFLRRGLPTCMVELEEVWDEALADELIRLEPSLDRERIGKIARLPFFGTVNGDFEQFGDPHPFSDVLSRENKRAMNEAVNSTADSIKNHWHHLQVKQNDSPVMTAAFIEPYDVFIALPTGQLKPYARRLEAALQKAGHSAMLFDHNQILSADQARQQPQLILEVTRAAIGRAKMWVQLVDGMPGREIDGDTPLVHHQHALMKQAGDDVHGWLLPDIDREECSAKHRTFLDQANYNQQTYEEFERFILKHAQSQREQAEAQAKIRDRSVQSNSTFVGVDFAGVDEPTATLLLNELERRNVNAFPIDEDNIGREKLEDAVRGNEGFLMVYTSKPESRSRIIAHFRIVQRFKTRDEDIDLDIGLTISDPQAPRPVGADLHVIEIDPDSGSVDPVAMSRFVDSVNERAMARLH